MDSGSLSVIWYIEETFHIIWRPSLTSVYLVNLVLYIHPFLPVKHLSGLTYCDIQHSSKWTETCIVSVARFEWHCSHMPKQSKQKESMYEDAYKWLQTCMTWIHPRLVQTWCWWNLSILPHFPALNTSSRRCSQPFVFRVHIYSFILAIYWFQEVWLHVLLQYRTALHPWAAH